MRASGHWMATDNKYQLQIKHVSVLGNINLT